MTTQTPDEIAEILESVQDYKVLVNAWDLYQTILQCVPDADPVSTAERVVDAMVAQAESLTEADLVRMPGLHNVWTKRDWLRGQWLDSDKFQDVIPDYSVPSPPPSRKGYAEPYPHPAVNLVELEYPTIYKAFWLAKLNDDIHVFHETAQVTVRGLTMDTVGTTYADSLIQCCCEQARKKAYFATA